MRDTMMRSSSQRSHVGAGWGRATPAVADRESARREAGLRWKGAAAAHAPFLRPLPPVGMPVFRDDKDPISTTPEMLVCLYV